MVMDYKEILCTLTQSDIRRIIIYSCKILGQRETSHAVVLAGQNPTEGIYSWNTRGEGAYSINQ